MEKKDKKQQTNKKKLTKKKKKKKLWKCICNWPLLPSGKQNIGHLLILNDTLNFFVLFSFLILIQEKKIKKKFDFFPKFYACVNIIFQMWPYGLKYTLDLVYHANYYQMDDKSKLFIIC